MITLSGLQPYEDIDIQVIGLRTGEKLFEELLANEENTMATPHPEVRVACARKVPENTIKIALEIVRKSEDLTADGIKHELDNFLEEYTPQFNNPKERAEGIVTSAKYRQ